MKTIHVIFGLFALSSISAWAGTTSQPIDAYLTQTLVNSDAHGFKVTKVEYVKRPTVETHDDSQCRPYLEPGYPCEQVSYSQYVSAVKVSYSFASESESLNQDNGSPFYEDTFYVNPSTLSPAAHAKLVPGQKLKGKAAAAFAQVVTQTDHAAFSEIDESKSVFCARGYDDNGSYLRDPNCKDQLAYKTVYKPVTHAMVVIK